MSIWTQVAGVIRFDSLVNKKIDVGITYCYADDGDVWDLCNVPCGSEGSLQVSRWVNPIEDSIAKYTISIFGSLRDYDNDQEIIEYFDKITKNEIVRQATFTISNNGGEARTFVWTNEGHDYAFKEVF